LTIIDQNCIFLAVIPVGRGKGLNGQVKNTTTRKKLPGKINDQPL
jgi:hypothetical protein